MSFTELSNIFSLKELPESEVELTGDVPFAEIEKYRDRALVHFQENLELPGFRKGKVPPAMVLQNVGDLAILQEAADLFMRDFYPALIEHKKLDVVTRPQIRILKLAAGNPVTFSITTALYPTVVLPKNYKGIGAATPLPKAEDVQEEEVAETLKSLQQNRTTKDAEGKDVTPELTDEFARTIGAFKDLEDLKEQVRKGIAAQKERTGKEKRRTAILDTLLEQASVAIPAVFVESELQKIIAQMKDDVTRLGMSFEEYLKRSKKTEEDMRNEFRDQARKRAKLQLTLNKIAEEEKIEADEQAVEEEMKHALQHFPDARPELLKIHIQTVLRNEKVLKLLEGEENT